MGTPYRVYGELAHIPHPLNPDKSLCLNVDFRTWDKYLSVRKGFWMCHDCEKTIEAILELSETIRPL